MCWAVYIASTDPLPDCEPTPAFRVQVEDQYARELASLLQFYPHFLYAGSSSGCGCDFINEDGTDDGQQSRLELAQYVANTIDANKHVALYFCWEGSQGKPIVKSETVTIADLKRLDFEIDDRGTILKIAT